MRNEKDKKRKPTLKVPEFIRENKTSIVLASMKHLRV